MTAGLPGVGIGGLFYLATALLMPMRSLVALATGRAEEARWGVALRQAGLAAAIVAMIWATGWAIGWAIAAFAAPAAATVAGTARLEHVQSVVRTTAVIGSLGVLALVLVTVQVLRLVMPPRPTPRAVLDGADRERTAA